MKTKYMFVDVESVGLYGEGFQIGWVVTDLAGKEIQKGRIACPHKNASGTFSGHEWCANNTIKVKPTCATIEPYETFEKVNLCFDSPMLVRHHFYSIYKHWSAHATLVADCPYPVEANFFTTMLKEQADEWGGPYPFIDVASVRFAAGLAPLETCERLPTELPAHDPLADARQSARLFFEALLAIKTK